MAQTAPTTIQLPLPTGTHQPKVDLGLPNYDRRKDRGNYLVVSLGNGEINFSSYCSSFSHALAMTRLSKRDPTWVLSGLEEELVAFKHICEIKASWLTPKIVNNFIRSQLGKTLQIVTTVNV